MARRDVRNREADLRARDEAAREDGVRAFCPCHAGWEVFEQNVQVVFRSLKDSNRAVRADALHVLDDAARMQIAEELKYYIVPGEEKLEEKRARGRSIQERLEARRERKIRRLKGNHRTH
jgi:hypothetical protein